MSHVKIDEALCKGCLLCVTACPKEILRQADRFNQQGYKVAEVDPDKADECTGCAACGKMCPDIAITVWRTQKAKKEAAHGE
ncbi:4Fe-4S dicluster domain-containing protein [Desulfovibrio inopinatus]|uniref:4Fe-4S dicluster domain-containing protein n=1 Tax=Desulfovibrio inopinatus TaxID=102109 RepID=UPI000424D6DB|nr:4Fe-4S dicluster domain-containing protein [Desulfovibrio inopinatus]